MLECLFIKQEGYYNSALFSSDKNVIVGRVYKGKRSYEALMLDEERATAFVFGTKGDEGLYSVKECNGKYWAVGHSGNNSLLVMYDRERRKVKQYIGPKGILWQVDCQLAVGGQKGKRWHLMLLSLDGKKVKIYSHEENIYAYSLVKTEGGYVVVGRVGKEGNYDGFLLWLNQKQKPTEALKTNWKENDYLRYVGSRLAVGRLEVDGDSEGLLVDLESLRAKIYRRQGFDYFRYADKDKVFGEGDDGDGLRKALFVKNESYRLLGDGFSAIRFYDRGSGVAYGYMYLGGFSHGLRLVMPPVDGGQKYRVEPLNLAWTQLNLKPKGKGYRLTLQTSKVKKVLYTWENCHTPP
ncbi:MAG: hypothetical protein RMK75_00690 [Aquificaceae bacterium]|nr:hypothetical protein [Aquificaceae bacterium]MDW8422830.1 hypothetical protein [Aquificaceae bacterium]